MVRLVVSVAPEAEIDHAVVQEQRRSLILVERVERHAAVLRADACSGHAGLDHHGAAQLLRARREVERVQPVEIAGRTFFRLGDHVERPRARVDDRRAGDADLGCDVATLAGIAVRNRRHACSLIDEADFPQRRAASSVGIERVHAVVLRRHIHDVPNADAGDGHIRHVQRRGM